MKINNQQYENIIRFIDKKFDLYYGKYDFHKYSLDNYKEYQENFSNLKNENRYIEDALKWKWGHAGKKNYPLAHKKIVEEVKDNWSKFAEQKYKNPKDTFDFWRNVFKRNTTYITSAYITHLVHFTEIPIIDQHNYRAFNTLLKCFVNRNLQFKKKPSNWNDILQLKEFINYISDVKNINKEELDKFLMMYGKSLKG